MGYRAMKMLRYFALLALLATQPALAQWQTPNHSVPIGQGGGNIGFNNAAPGTAGQALVSNGASADPSFGAISNAALGTAPANTAKCNPTSGVAAIQDCTAAQLTTLISSGRVNAIAVVGSYAIAATDCSKVVSATSTAAATISLPSAAGFATGCRITVCNNNGNNASGRAFKLSGFPSPWYPRLWMTLCGTVVNVGGGWQSESAPPRLAAAFSPQIFVDPSGNDANDGLISNAAGNPIATLQTCFSILQAELDLTNSGIPYCLLTSGGVFTGPQITFSRGGTGNGVIYVVGNGGIATLRTTGNVVLEEYDYAGYIIFANIQFDCSFAGSHPCYGLFMHQEVGTDLSNGSGLSAPSVYFNGGGTTDLAVWCDSRCKVNAAAPVFFTGSWGIGIRADLSSVIKLDQGANHNASVAGALIQISGGSQLLWSGTLTLGASNSAAKFLLANGGGTGARFSTFSLAGSAISGGTQSYLVLNNAWMCNASATALPGTAGAITAAGALTGLATGPSGTCDP